MPEGNFERLPEFLAIRGIVSIGTLGAHGADDSSTKLAVNLMVRGVGGRKDLEKLLEVDNTLCRECNRPRGTLHAGYHSFLRETPLEFISFALHQLEKRYLITFLRGAEERGPQIDQVNAYADAVELLRRRLGVDGVGVGCRRGLRNIVSDH